MRVIGGGASVSNNETSFINESSPTSSRTGWVAVAFGATPTTMTVTAICTAVTNSTG
jgi:hypothetical protein